MRISKGARRKGRTTQLIDEAVQCLFTEGAIFVPKSSRHVFDKFKIKNDVIKCFVDVDAHINNLAQNNFYHRLLSRLDLEHKGQVIIEDNYIRVKTNNEVCM